MSPSELSSAQPGPIRVGGRVIDVAGAQLVLADAFGSVQIELRAEANDEPLAAGDLVVLEASHEPGNGWQATLRQRHRPIGSHPPSSSSEHRRLFERGVAERLRKRAAVITAARRFFAERDYLEVDTPTLVPCPGLDLHLDAFALQRDRAEPERYLNTSPEYQMKRLLAGGLPRLFQLARCFRRGEQGQRHNPEFVMLEWYRAFAGVESMMQETEQLVRSVFADCSIDLLAGGEHRVDLAAPFARISVCEAFARYADATAEQVLSWASHDEERFFRLLIERVEPALARLGTAVFLYDYPASQASLARRKPDDEQLCERFELYVGDLELCNGFGELTDPAEQRERLQNDQGRRAAQGKPVYPLDQRFLAALEQGLPPCTGNALGLDRLVQLCCGTADISDCMPFPFQWI